MAYLCVQLPRTLKGGESCFYYYKGKNHDDFTFVDYDGNYYHYHASLNADMTEYDSDIAKKLAFGEGEYFKISAYFLPNYDVSYFMYLPRFVK